MSTVLILDFYGVIYDPQARGPMKGLREFLALVQLQGVPCGIASSSPKEHIQDFLEEHKLDQYFSVIIGLNEVERTKPDPECYLAVAVACSASPSECVVVDDSLDSIASAKQAGFTTYYFDNFNLDNFQKISTMLNL